MDYRDISNDIKRNKRVVRRYYGIIERVVLEAYKRGIYIDMGYVLLGFNNEMLKLYRMKGLRKKVDVYIEVDESKKESNNEIIRKVNKNGKKQYYKGTGEPILDKGRERSKS